MKNLAFFTVSVVLLFGGLMLLTARSPFSILLIALGGAALFVSAYSALNRSQKTQGEAT